MSRYTVNSKGKKIVYGFDNPLSQFFLDIDGKHICGPLSPVYGSNYEMLAALRRNGIEKMIPQIHIDAITDDLTF